MEKANMKTPISIVILIIGISVNESNQWFSIFQRYVGREYSLKVIKYHQFAMRFWKILKNRNKKIKK